MPNETELWIERFEEGLELIERDFELIERYDPEAIAIALGDHGQSLLAVRWADAERAAKYDGAIVTNQDVFPVVFAYLADDEAWLEYCPGKLFWGPEFGRTGEVGFEKGKMVLEKW